MQYITTRSLLDLCEGVERAPGAQVEMWWCEKSDINQTGSREAAATVSESKEGGVE